MSVGPASGSRSSVNEQQAAARRAAEEARRAAEAARRAAEAARKAAEAQQAAEAARKSNTAFEGQTRQTDFGKRLGAEAPATSLLTEDAKDGQVNCLDVAADWADKATPELRAKSDMVFLKDTRAGKEGESGHVVIRQGDKVLDPTTNKSYESMDAFKKAQPHYQEAGSLSASSVKRILDTKPGSPERAAALDKAKVPAELQKMMVADETSPRNPRVAERELAQTSLTDANTALKEAKDAAQKAATLPPGPEADQAKKAALDAATRALEAQRNANGAAKGVGEKLPFPDADKAKVTNAVDAAILLSPEEQTKLFGAALPATPDEAIRAKAQEVLDATKGCSPSGPGAAALQEALDGPYPPETKKKLLAALAPGLGEMAKKALSLDPGQDVRPMLDALTVAAKADPALKNSIISGLAEGVSTKGLPDEAKEALSGLISKPGGAELGVGLAQKLSESNKTLAVADVSRAVSGGIETERKNFEERQKKVKELDEVLAKHIGGMGDSLTDTQRDVAIRDFRERHQEYGDLEAAAGKLQGVVDAGLAFEPPGSVRDPNAKRPEWETKLRNEIGAVKEQVPDFINTSSGQAWLQKELNKQFEGQPSPAMEHLLDVAKLGKLGSDVGTKIASAMTSAIGEFVLRKAANKDMEGAKRLLGSLEQKAALFGTTPDQMKKICDGLKAVMAGEKDAQTKLSDDIGAIPGGQALRGLGMACTLVQLVESGGKLDDAKLSEKITTAGDALALTGDGAAMFLRMTGPAANVPALLGRLSGVGNAVVAVGEGFKAIEAFNEKEYLQAGSKTLLCGGGLGLAMASVVAVPLWGLAIAGGAFAVGALGSFVADELKEGKDKDDVKKSLEAAGVKDPVASVMLDADPKTLKQLGKDLKLPPEQVQQLAVKYPKLLDTSATALTKMKDMMEAYGHQPAELVAMLDAYTQGSKDPEQDIENFVRRCRTDLTRPMKTREDWDRFFDRAKYPNGPNVQLDNLRRYLDTKP
ncbi:hypothetical protein [Myxococcus sp. CA040A]|uniref:hypothetical protein n=1 Tax=Myxococcus sp. CA040A TaxID=2741738 RepID=UPI00157A4C75|nr:hypothetical protein [Myxococcus sp. CA040A]NTX04574.1 hypothetical protein [Myxococcus sp. CA040A]